MKRQFFFAAMLLVAVLSFQSCSGDKTKKGREEQRKPAPAAGEQKAGGAATPNQVPASMAKPVFQRTPAALLAALPCKMAGKQGVFAVFPDNTVSGQICFGLYSARFAAQDIRQFDIQSGGMHIIFHDVAGREQPGAIKLMKWEERDARPCLEAACGKEIPVKTETYSAPGDSGWTYIIVTPDPAIDLASVHGAYYGLIMGADKYIPLFK